MYAFCVRGIATLRAWLIAPAWTSSTRARPGRIGSPAASADVWPSGRRAFERRSNVAALYTLQPSSGCGTASNNSNSRQIAATQDQHVVVGGGVAPASSIGASPGMGYGPASLSAAMPRPTWNLMGTSGWSSGTIRYGMP